jgi:hypothetical protein
MLNPRTKIHVEFVLCEKIKIFLKSLMWNKTTCNKQKIIEEKF